MGLRILLCAGALAAAVPPAAALAETLVATRTIRATETIGPQDVTLVAGAMPGGLSDPAAVIGLEARVALYAGRPIRSSDVGPAAIVDRNQIVTLAFRDGGLAITTEGRALGRGGVGDVVRAMNLASRSTVAGVIGPEGAVHVSTSRMPLN